MERSIRRLEENLLPEGPKPQAPSPKSVLMFSVSSKCLSTSASLSEVTTAFFVDDYPAGYVLETQSPSWGELDSQGKKKLRNKFSLIKRAVRLVLKCMQTRFPSTMATVRSTRKTFSPLPEQLKNKSVQPSGF
jgi:hypothetical protein